jgi:hypothetical protein
MIRRKRCATCEWFESAEDVEERCKANKIEGWSTGSAFYSQCHREVRGEITHPEDWCSHWQEKE